MKDKRQHVRFPSSRPIVMLLGNKNIYATMTDFSRNGIGFIASSQPELDSTVEVHFDLVSPIEDNQLHPFQFKAKVKHCITYSHNSHIGVRLDVNSQDYFDIFDALDAEAKSAAMSALQQRQVNF